MIVFIALVVAAAVFLVISAVIARSVGRCDSRYIGKRCERPKGHATMHAKGGTWWTQDT